MLVGAIFSRVIGNNLPTSVYVAQSFVFKKEVTTGEQHNVKIQVDAINHMKKKVELLTQVFSEKGGELVVDGRATILYEHIF
jgi:acyl-CoA thioesterase FadM